jgi:hypothetical protein
MEIPGSFIKIFPEYQDVFFDDLENHRKYFLPLCSISLVFDLTGNELCTLIFSHFSPTSKQHQNQGYNAE